MTHEELIAYINKDIDEGAFVGAIGEWFPARSLFALRAVMELHKPVKRENYLDILMCDSCEHSSYPCSTIQAIEKELQ
jgi:hypothetical protein